MFGRFFGVAAALMPIPLTVSGAVAQELGGITQPEPMTDPENWLTSKDYPSSAGLRIETVKVTLRVGPDGRIRECWLRERAQFQEFNDRTCVLLNRRARFRPARNAEGQAISGEYRHSYRWAPPEPDAPKLFE